MDAITATSLAQDGQTTQAQSQKLSDDFDNFLVLLTTQLQNQDPLSPMDSTEFTNQLVGFSQVEQQISGNEKLEQLLSLQLSNMSTVALGYVGMDVNFLGDTAYFDGENDLPINYIQNEATVESNLRIVDEAGETIRTVPVDTAAGQFTFNWDGKNDRGEVMPVGNYKIFVDGENADGVGVAGQTAVPGRVEGIEAQDGIIQLILRGNSTVQVGSVLTARTPPATGQSEDQGGANDNT